MMEASFPQLLLPAILLGLMVLLGAAAALAWREVGKLRSQLRRENTRRRRAEKSCLAIRSHYQTLLEHAPFPTAVTDRDTGQILFLNAKGAETLQVRREDAMKGRIQAFYYDAGDREAVLDELSSVGRVDDREILMQRADRTPFLALVSVALIDYEGNPALFAAFRDISRRKEAEQGLRRSHDELEAVTDAVPVLIARADPEGRCQFANSTFAQWLHLDKEHLIDRPLAPLIAGEDREEFGRSVDLAFSGNAIECEARLPTPRGLLSLHLFLRPHFDMGTITSVLIVGNDITAEKEHAAVLHRLATEDELTGLMNRRAVLAAAEQALSDCLERNLPFSLAMIDLDHFKQVNDAHGHAAGDQVLQQIAKMLRREVRPDDLVGRMGGEEFLVVLPGACPQAAAQVAHRLRTRAEETVINADGHPIRQTMSIGVAVRDAAHPDLNSLIKTVDGLLYAAKEQGRNRVVEAEVVVEDRRG